MIGNLERNYRIVDSNKAIDIEAQINAQRDKMKKNNIDNIKKKKYPIKTSTYYNDLVSMCEKIGDYTINVTEALIEK